MTPSERAVAYLAALERADLDAILALFADEGVVHSPLYGTKPAADFFAGLFADTARSVLTHKATFIAEDGTGLALHFDYQWTLANGEVVTFEVVDVFRLAGDGRFASMTIIYDTAPLRAAFEANRLVA
jgi:ketosteroid isomerase-like protein